MSGQVIGTQASDDDGSVPPIGKTVTHDDLEETDDDVEGCPPERLFRAVGILMDKAWVLKGSVPCRIGCIDPIAAEKILPVKRRKRDFHDLFHLTVWTRRFGIFHEARERKNRPPEEGQAVRGQRSEEADADRGEADLLPGFAQRLPGKGR
jgi:hypothetical protein